MATRAPKFVVVRTTAGYHVRLVGANSQPVFTTEPYRDRRRAERAIAIAREAVQAGVLPLLVDERNQG